MSKYAFGFIMGTIASLFWAGIAMLFGHDLSNAIIVFLAGTLSSAFTSIAMQRNNRK